MEITLTWTRLICCFFIFLVLFALFGMGRDSAQLRQELMKGYEEEWKRTDTPINLLRGWPAPSLLPADLIKISANKVLNSLEVSTDALLYGPDPGYEPLRKNIAKWLTSFYRPTAGSIDAKRICITGGASQNLGCMLNVYTDPEYTRNIWIVAPAYFLAFRIFEDAGFGNKMRAVPEDEEGLDIEFLRKQIETSEQSAKERGVERPKYKPERTRAKVYKHIIYCVPTFANPSSRTMTYERRKDLVMLAREYGALIVCDDVYDFLQWPSDTSTGFSDRLKTLETAHLPRIVDIDRELHPRPGKESTDGFGNACSNGSFSKIAGPGIRVGWVEGTEKFAYGVSQTGTTASGGAPSQLTSTYINDLLQTGALQRHIRDNLRPVYASRYRKLMKAITTHLLPLGFELPQTKRDVIGGYFTWLYLPPSLSSAADALAKRCQKDANVVIAAGSIFEVPKDENGVKFGGNVRLCWAWEDEWKLEEGVRRIGIVAKKMIEEAEKGEGFVVVEKDGGSRNEGIDGFK